MGATETIRNCIVSRVEEALWGQVQLGRYGVFGLTPAKLQDPYWGAKQWTEQWVADRTDEYLRDVVFVAVCAVTNAVSDGFEPAHDIVWGGNIVRAAPRTGFRLLRTGGPL